MNWVTKEILFDFQDGLEAFCVEIGRWHYQGLTGAAINQPSDFHSVKVFLAEQMVFFVAR